LKTSSIIAFSFSTVFVSSAGPHRGSRTQHLLRLRLRGSEARGSWDPCGLETHSDPRTGLLMTSDVAHARPLSPGSGKGQRLRRTLLRGKKRAGVPSNALAAGPVAHDRRLGALDGARVLRDLHELGPVARVRRLAHPLSSRYAARNRSLENTVRCDSI
jgi:hypothetical protein